MKRTIGGAKLVLCNLGMACLACWASAEAQEATVLLSLAVQGDDEGSRGGALGVDWSVTERHWLAFSAGLSRPTEGFEDSDSVVGAADYGFQFSDHWSASIGVGLGDRDDFRSRVIRGDVLWQDESWRLGLQIEHNSAETTTRLVLPNRTLEIDNESEVTGFGPRLSFVGESGFGFAASYMGFSEPDNDVVLANEQLIDRLLNGELGRLLADGRIDRARVEGRLNDARFAATSSLTALLEDSLTVSLSQTINNHEIGFDYYRDTAAVLDVDLTNYSVRWLFPFLGEGNDLEISLGLSDVASESTLFGGVSFLMYR